MVSTLPHARDDRGGHRECGIPSLMRDGQHEAKSAQALQRMIEASANAWLSSADFIYEDVPRIKCIFFCEFHLTRGTLIQLKCEDENFKLDDVLPTQRFGSYSAAFIPKDELVNRQVRVGIHANGRKYKVMGYPVALKKEDKITSPPKTKYGLRIATWNKCEVPKESIEIYKRGKYRFCICFVVPHEIEATENDFVYEPVIEKLTEYIVGLEQERHWLSGRKSDEALQRLFEYTLISLNTTGAVCYQVTDHCCIYLKLSPLQMGHEPPEVYPHTVPIPQLEMWRWRRNKTRMDIVAQMIIPKIDGLRCVKEISIMTGLDVDLVIRCIRNLCYYEAVALVPFFLYSNNYVATEKLHNFFNDPDAIKECPDFVRRRVKGRRKRHPKLLARPTFHDVFRLYLNLKIGQRLSEFVIVNEPKTKMVDVRRFIQFGMVRGFLRKLSIYPLVMPEYKHIPALSIFNGTTALEDIAVEYAIEPTELHRKLIESGKMTFITK
ncbi:unnamed protein product, partial [Mesorhabditis spiculigera]